MTSKKKVITSKANSTTKTPSPTPPMLQVEVEEEDQTPTSAQPSPATIPEAPALPPTVSPQSSEPAAPAANTTENQPPSSNAGTRLSPLEVPASPAPPSLESSPQAQSSSSKLYLTILIVLILLISLGVGGYLLYSSGNLPFLNNSTPSSSTSPSATPTPTLSPSPSPSHSGLTREEISLEVLNGTTIAGLASKSADALELLGYDIARTGNSPTDAEVTMVYVQKELEDSLLVLLSDLQESFGVASISGYLEDSEATARIVLGPDAN